MGIYTNQQRLVKAFGESEIIDLTNSGGDSIDVDVVDAAIDRVDNEINSRVYNRDTTPLTQAQIDASALPGFADDMVRFYLFDDGVLEVVENRYKAAIDWLNLYARGLVGLGVANGDTGQPASTQTIKSGCGKSRFNWAAY